MTGQFVSMNIQKVFKARPISLANFETCNRKNHGALKEYFLMFLPLKKGKNLSENYLYISKKLKDFNFN